MPVHTFTQPRGQLVSLTVDSAALRYNLLGDPSTRQVLVYLPADYHTPDAHYPVHLVARIPRLLWAIYHKNSTLQAEKIPANTYAVAGSAFIDGTHGCRRSGLPVFLSFMRFLAPHLLNLAWLALIPLALYLFRKKAKRVPVSTRLFFRSLSREHQESAWLRKLKKWLSLLLTLLIIAALVLALSRPTGETGTDSPGAVIVLVDRSASMAAVDAQGRSRLEITRQQLRDQRGDAAGAEDDDAGEGREVAVDGPHAEVADGGEGGGEGKSNNLLFSLLFLSYRLIFSILRI